ncbi:MAG: single-stranded DNA-binding protein [Helicobacteraceae bacterium]|nr:single-stranded DNA-binding protein [Helicobacteraceae bacterium]
MLNKVILIGNLTRDVELRYTQSGTAIAKFGLAVSRRWKDKNSSEDREEVMFIDINVFGRSAEIANQYLNKGRRVLIEGRLVLDQWTDQNGQRHSRHNISAENVQFLDSKGSGEGGYARSTQQSGDSGGFESPASKQSQSVESDGGYARSAQQSSDSSGFESPASKPSQNIDIDDDSIPF